MKVLVTYFSQTGNTEKLAQAVHEEAAGSHDSELKKIEEMNAAGLGDYNVVFIGTPIHAGGLSGPVKDFLGKLPENPGFGLAALVTHASPVYEKAAFEKGLKDLESICKEKGINYLGCFDCQGKLAEPIRPMVQQARGISDEEWAKIMAETDKHPDEGDLKNAREFAEEALKK